MKLVKVKKNSYGIGFISNGYGFGIGLLSWPWVILDFPGLNFWDRLCWCGWFFEKGIERFQIRYLWFTVVYIFPHNPPAPKRSQP